MLSVPKENLVEDKRIAADGHYNIHINIHYLEHKKHVFEFFRVKKVVLTGCLCAQTLYVYARIGKTMYAR